MSVTTTTPLPVSTASASLDRDGANALLLADDMLDGGKIFLGQTTMGDDHDTDHGCFPSHQCCAGSGPVGWQRGIASLQFAMPY